MIKRTISKLAQEAGVNVETIRFYEKKGLIQQPQKPIQGYRQYPDETLEKIRFIKRAKELGFTLDEIAHLLSLEELPCSQVQALSQHKLNTVQAKLKDLNRLEKALIELLKQCNNNEDESYCPVIDSLQP
tara:strand:+ start:470 stop:859 length:390 start_codon:yes stop_codon:yes gene_type:complete